MDKEQEAFRKEILGRVIRVAVADGRIFYGHFVCLDHQMNIILDDGLCQLPKAMVSPINQKIVNYSDNLKKPENYLQGTLTPEQADEFKSDKFFCGKTLIPGRMILKVQIQDQIKDETKEIKQEIKQDIKDESKEEIKGEINEEIKKETKQDHISSPI